MKFLSRFSHRVIITNMSIRINLCNRVIESLIPDFVVDFVHVIVIVEEILVPSSLENAEIPGLRPFDVIRYEPPLDSLLQYQLRVVLQRRVLIDMTPHIRALRVIVWSFLPQGHPVD